MSLGCWLKQGHESLRSSHSPRSGEGEGPCLASHSSSNGSIFPHTICGVQSTRRGQSTLAAATTSGRRSHLGSVGSGKRSELSSASPARQQSSVSPEAFPAHRRHHRVCALYLRQVGRAGNAAALSEAGAAARLEQGAGQTTLVLAAAAGGSAGGPRLETCGGGRQPSRWPMRSPLRPQSRLTCGTRIGTRQRRAGHSLLRLRRRRECRSSGSQFFCCGLCTCCWSRSRALLKEGDETGMCVGEEE